MRHQARALIGHEAHAEPDAYLDAPAEVNLLIMEAENDAPDEVLIDWPLPHGTQSTLSYRGFATNPAQTATPRPRQRQRAFTSLIYRRPRIWRSLRQRRSAPVGLTRLHPRHPRPAHQPDRDLGHFLRGRCSV